MLALDEHDISYRFGMFTLEFYFEIQPILNFHAIMLIES